MKGWKVLLAGLLCLLLWVLSFAPAEQSWLAWFAMLPWCVMARRLGGWRGFLFGYLSGAGILLTGCWWLGLSHLTNLALMVAAEAVFYGLFFLALRRLLTVRRWPAVLAVPVCLVPMEYLRGVVPLDGFPWLLLGYSQHGVPWVLQTADLWGVLGVTALLGATGGMLHDLWCGFRQGRAPGVPVLAWALILSGSLAYGAVRWRPRDEGTPGPRLLLVQPSLEQALKTSYRLEEVLERHAELTVAALARSDTNPEVVVWSETILAPLWLDHNDEWNHEIWTQVRELVAPALQQTGAWFLSGATVYHEDPDRGALHNSAVLYSPDRVRQDITHKRTLVPGGEYLPWIRSWPASWCEWVQGVVRDMAGWVPDLEPGQDLGLMAVPDGSGGTAEAGVSICYEIAYPAILREQVRGGATFLVNLSNEAWFPESAEFAQYTAMARFRAVEFRRSLVRCANSGTSGLIDAYGGLELLEKDGRRHGFAGTIQVRPDLRTDGTLFGTWGDWLPWSLMILAGAALFLPRRRDSQGKPVTRASGPTL